MKSGDDKGFTLVEVLVTVSLVILVFLLHFQSALVIVRTLPISVLIAFITMKLMGVTSIRDITVSAASAAETSAVADAIAVGRALEPYGLLFIEEPLLSENPEGLKQIGRNLYVETDASGPAVTGVPESDGLGAASDKEHLGRGRRR